MNTAEATLQAIEQLWPELPALVGADWPQLEAQLTPLLAQARRDPANAGDVCARIVALFDGHGEARSRLVAAMQGPVGAAAPAAGAGAASGAPPPPAPAATVRQTNIRVSPAGLEASAGFPGQPVRPAEASNPEDHPNSDGDTDIQRTKVVARQARPHRGRAMLAIIAAMLAAGVLFLLWGSLRYGGPDGLWRRLDMEITSRLPRRAAYVPTPLPVTPATTSAITRSPAAAATHTPTLSSTATHAPITPTQSAVRSMTPAYTPTPRHTPAPTPTPPHPHTPTPTPVASLRLAGLAHAWQTWNNCGPATLAMDLSYFGLKIDQGVVSAALRPFRDDKNVNPEELAAYARVQGLAALARVDGDAGRLRQLLGAGVPVLIETWYEPKPNDGMGHYRLLVGYDDAAGEWIAYDSYDSRGVIKGQPYAGIRLPYAETEPLWAVFNRAYVVVYDAPRAAAVEAILGADLEDEAMWRGSLARAEAAVAADGDDPFAWFNLGSSLTALGDYGPAADAFDRARRIGLPWRMLWYQFAPFRAYYETGRYPEVIALADATLRSAKDTIEEVYFWKGMAQAAAGDPVSARASWQRSLELNPNYGEARAALEALPQ